MIIITTKEAAQLLKVTPKTVCEYIKKGRLIPKISGIHQYLFDKQDVIDFKKVPGGRPRKGK